MKEKKDNTSQSVDIEILRKYINTKFKELRIKELPIDAMVFEERVKQKCFHCKNYNRKWTCPPRMNHIDYLKLFSEYENCAVIYCEMSVTAENFESMRNKTTNTVHRALLYLEQQLYNHNESMALSFIGGSCKLCKNGCGKDGCVNPYLSRTPWEATGCNVIKTLDKIGIKVKFPITDTLCRYGIILW